MRTINLNETVREVLEVELGDEKYKVPLGSALSVDEIKRLDNWDNIISFFEKYIPSEKLKLLSVAQLTALFDAWSDNTKDVTGKPLGH